MTGPADDRIGRLIRSALDGFPVADPDPARLVAAGRRRRRQRRRLGTAVGAALVAAAVIGGVIAAHPDTSQTRIRVSGTGPSASQPISRFPVLRPGESCPATSGRPVSNPYFVGDELGQGPVRMLVANAGDLRHGIVYVGAADKGNPLGPPNFYAFQDFWYSLPAYQGTWTVVGRRLDGAGQVRFGNSDPTAIAPAVLAGASQAFGPGYRSGVGSTWINEPGCYGFQVRGPNLDEIIIVDVVLE